MRKKTAVNVLSATLALAVMAAPAWTSALAEETTFTPGTYTGASQGHDSDVTVEATFTEDGLASVSIDASGETPEIGGAAVDTLTEQFLKAQGTGIDGVAGATETTEAAKRALQQAIDAAAGTEAEAAELTDGVYTASASSFGTKQQMTGEVTIADGKIADIVITDESDSQTGQWFGVAERLLIPRILDAQTLGVDSITGATTSSGAIKSIVAQALEQAGGNVNDWYTPVEKSEETVVLEDYDVVVVGLGGSGVLSYAAAADDGATVFGIEAAGEIGGNSVSTFGPMVINSKIQAEKYNNGEDNIDADAVYEVWMNYVGTDEKEDIIKETVYRDGEIMDYYMDTFGFSFDGESFLGPAGYLPSFVIPEWDKDYVVFTASEDNTKWYDLGPDKVWQYQDALDAAKAMNEKNDYMLELKADDLIFDEDGSVIGVHATYYDGTQYEIYGKTVILATGGFLGNEEMMKEVYGSTIHSLGDLVNSGAGINMGISAGGTTYALATLPMTHISQIPNLIRDDSLTADEKSILTSLALATDVKEIADDGTVLVSGDASDLEGDTNLSVEIVYAPGFHYYNVYSEDDINNIRENGLSENAAAAFPIAFTSGGVTPAAGTPIETIDHILDVAVETKNAFYGNAAELAEQLGWDADVVAQSLGDSEGNYYLVEVAGYSYGTVGGLDIDANMNVLRDDGTPIENLFAVGQDSQGVENKEGEAYTPWGGQAQMWIFVSGKIAGDQAAAYALAQ